MQITVGSQALVFLYSVAGGILIAFTYDLFRIRRKAIKAGNLLVHIEDFLYWVLVLLIMLGMTFYSNDGELRGYILLGAVIGAVLYMLMLSKLIVDSSVFILRLIGKFFKTIWLVLAYPFKVLYNVVKIPCDFVVKQANKLLRKLRGTARAKLTKVSFKKRLFFNLRKKI